MPHLDLTAHQSRLSFADTVRKVTLDSTDAHDEPRRLELVGNVRVVFVCALNRRGGPVQSVSTLAKKLTAMGHDVEVVAPGIRDSASVFTPDAGALIEIPVLNSLWGGVFAQWKILRAVGFRQRRRTVLHANGLPELLACVPALLILRAPCFLWFHSSSLDRSRHSASIVRLLRRFNRIQFAAVSPTAALLLSEFDDSEPIDLLPNPFDDSVICTTKAPLRDHGALRVGFVSGGIGELKGGDILAACIQNADPERFEWMVYASSNAQSAAALGPCVSASNVSVRDKVTDPAKLYCDIDVILAPSRLETFGRIIVEAWLNELPVVASDIPAFRDLSAGEDFGGKLVNLTDTQGFVEALEHMRSPELRSRYARLGEQVARREYHIDVVAPRVLAMYESLLRQSSTKRRRGGTHHR
jgi:glycosyltransferase involved in cell wall biosynthesis